MYQFKAKGSEMKPYAQCLGNLSKDFTVDNMKKNLSKMDQNLFVYDISIDHDTVGVSDILNIHKYLMKNML